MIRIIDKENLLTSKYHGINNVLNSRKVLVEKVSAITADQIGLMAKEIAKMLLSQLVFGNNAPLKLDHKTKAQKPTLSDDERDRFLFSATKSIAKVITNSFSRANAFVDHGGALHFSDLDKTELNILNEILQNAKIQKAVTFIPQNYWIFFRLLNETDDLKDAHLVFSFTEEANFLSNSLRSELQRHKFTLSDLEVTY